MIVKVKIAKDENLITYIKMIRSYNQKLSIGEIKRRIENNDTVIESDTSGYDFNNEFPKGFSEDDYNFEFYKFLGGVYDDSAR